MSISVPGTDITISVGVPSPSQALNEIEGDVAVAGNLGNAALPYIHQYAGYTADLASICAAASAETIVGGVSCGSLALLAGALTAGSGGVLYLEHRESGTVAVLDFGALGASGLASALETSARAAEAAGATDRAIGQIRLLRASEAPLYARPGLWISGQILELKAALWEEIATSLSAGARSAGGSSAGLGIAGAVVGDQSGVNCPT